MPLPSPKLSHAKALEGVNERLERGDPVAAWEWVLGARRWRLFLQAAAQNPLMGEDLRPRVWGGAATDWRRLGELCAQKLVEVFGPEASEREQFLRASRPEFFEGAARVIPQESWLRLARAEAGEAGLGQGGARRFKNALLLFPADFQEALMEMDWSARFAASSGAAADAKRDWIGCLAGWESVEPLRRAVDFFAAKGLSPAALLSPERPGQAGALAHAVGAQSEACSRFILSRLPGVSALESTRDAIDLWGEIWSSVFDPVRAERLVAERKAFAERLDLELGALGPAQAPSSRRAAL